MAQRLKDSPVVRTLARDLGLRASGDSLQAIVQHARRKVANIARECGCTTLIDLLSKTATQVETSFIEIHSDEDLDRTQEKYLSLGERAFANLRSQLGPDVFAITFRRRNQKPFERPFVSIIDCRDEKAARRYFSKWHEVAHLLTLTSQQRLKFCRSHEPAQTKDPEESVMDVIAASVGYLDSIIRPRVTGPPSLATMRALKEELCPESSNIAWAMGFVNALRDPALYIEADLALRKGEALAANQGGFPFHSAPQPTLRAVHVTQNAEARARGFLIPQQFRVPMKSVIRLAIDASDELVADEDLSWWSSTTGGPLEEWPIRVTAMRSGRRSQAIVVARR